MATTPWRERLRRAVEEAAEALAKESTQEEDPTRPPSPGDLYVFGLAVEVAVEWLVVREHPDDPGLLAVVPADEFPLVGTPDVSLPPDLDGRPLTVRCSEGLWLTRSVCVPRLRVGTLPDEALRLVRRRLAELARGQAVGSDDQRQADFDTEYETWMELVAQAREQLQRRADRTPTDLGLVIPFAQLTKHAPAELHIPPPQALAAASGSPLVAALSNALIANEIRYHEVSFGPESKLILMAGPHGVSGVWVGPAGSTPPRLAVLDGAGESRQATWKGGPEQRLCRTEPLFTWTDGRVVLVIGTEPPERLTIQR